MDSIYEQVKHRIREKQIGDREFFESPEFRRHMEGIIQAQAERYRPNNRVKVVASYTTDDFIACTDNDTVYLNTAFRWDEEMHETRAEQFYDVLGALTHELGHILYTDFPVKKRWSEALQQKGKLLYGAHDAEGQKSFEEWITDGQVRSLVMLLAASLDNILEDGFIENELLRNYHGTLRKGLLRMRMLQQTTSPSLAECIEKDVPLSSLLSNAILDYALFGQIKWARPEDSDGEKHTKETVYPVLKDMLPIVDAAVTTYDAKERKRYLNDLLVAFKPVLEQEIETTDSMSYFTDGPRQYSNTPQGHSSPIQQPNPLNGGGGSPRENGKDRQIVIRNEKSQQTDSQNSPPAENQPVNPPESPENDSSEPGNSGNGQQTDSQDFPTGIAGSPSAAENSPRNDGNDSEKGPKGDTKASTDNSSSQSDDQNGSRAATSENSSDAASNPFAAHSDKPGEGDGNPFAEDTNIDPDDEALQQILNQMRENAFNEEYERAILEDAKKDTSMRLERPIEIDDRLIEVYNQIAPEVLAISSRLRRSVQSQIRDSERGGKERGLMNGRRMDVGRIYRNDGKFFQRSKLPEDLPRMCVGLLIDCSGSMDISTRIGAARKAAVCLHDFCKQLHFPVSVVGFDNSLIDVAEFESRDGNDKYRVVSLEASGGTNDTGAVAFMRKRLEKRPEPEKLIIVLSDGAGQGNMPQQLELCRKSRINLIAGCLANDDRTRLRSQYGSCFVDMENLELLPTTLTAALKKRLKF